MNIVHIASELAPFAKVGGLADMVYGLAQECRRLGARVEVIIPKYDHCFKEAQMVMQNLKSFDGPNSYDNTIWRIDVHGLTVTLVEPHHPEQLFRRGLIYGCPDDVSRFIYFSRAALEYLYKRKDKIDVIHVHDWSTAICAPLIKQMYLLLGLAVKKCVLTIHNLEHQGLCTVQDLSQSGLNGKDFLTSDKMQDVKNPELINLLKGGIIYATDVTTVSPRYEKEIKTPLGGAGLDTLLTHVQHKLKGILNGIDLDYWRPDFTIEQKKDKKSALQKKLKLETSDAPLACAVTRLATQKAPDLIRHAIFRTLEKGGQFVLVGTPASPEIDQMFRKVKKELSKNKKVAIVLDYDEPLSKLVFAGADMIVIPSLFEPCGLTQMIAQRYGTVPVVRATGGLADTVFEGETGFLFEYPDEAGVNWALDRALACCRDQKEAWKKLIQNGMSRDFGWKKPAEEYMKVYSDSARLI